jgi:hypothetical protein
MSTFDLKLPDASVLQRLQEQGVKRGVPSPVNRFSPASTHFSKAQKCLPTAEAPGVRIPLLQQLQPPVNTSPSSLPPRTVSRVSSSRFHMAFKAQLQVQETEFGCSRSA